MRLMDDLIDEKDLLRESDRVAVDVIEDVLLDFMSTLRYFSKGIGVGTDLGICLFWDSLSEAEKKECEPFDGVECSNILDERGVLSYEDFYYYLRVASNTYIQLYPQDAAEVEELLAAWRKRFNIGEKA